MYDRFFEEKKRLGLIFTWHNINPNLPYESINKRTGKPVEQPGDPTWWSRLSCRYRDANEQREFVASGCIDKALPPKKL
jgi:hypothetical protein